MKKIGYVIVTIILALIVIFNLCSILNTSFFGYRIYRIGSGSMSPELKVGEYILVKKNNTYKVGDIITYKSKNSYITHRVVYVKDKNIITKGDKNNLNDEAITKNKVVGKVISKLKVVNFIVKLLSIPYTWLVILILGVANILFFSRYRLEDKKIIDKEVL